MNKEFIKKIVQAKCLEYEAFKEIMPKSVRQRVEEIESGAMDAVKEVVIDVFMQRSMSDKFVKSETNHNKDVGKNSDTNKKTSRIAVDFEELDDMNTDNCVIKRNKNEVADSTDLQNNRNVKKKKLDEVNKKTAKRVEVDFI